MRPSSTMQTAHVDKGLVREIVMRASSDINDQAQMLSAMTNLYSDKKAATYRETSTNAADSHAAAGQTRPIEVTLPTSDNPRFVVQDFGTGMSADDIERIYSLYGRSTKRESDTETGMLGFGCKAPLTYVLSFTLEAIKDGCKTNAVITKNEQGIGTIKIMSETVTTAPNGVTVTVPIPPQEIQSFADGARTFYRYWREGVLVDGEAPEPFDYDTWLDPDVVITGRGDGRSYVVMGNVAYRYDTKTGYPSTIAWVPMGAVNFTPSREDLMYDEVTEYTLGKIREFIKSTLSRTITEKITACETEYDRIRAISKLRRTLPYSYQHPLLKTVNLNLSRERQQAGRSMWQVRSGERKSETWLSDAWLTDDRPGDLGPRWRFVTNFPYKRVANLHMDMLDAAGIEQPYVVIPENPGFSTQGFPGISWDKVPALPKQERLKIDTVYDRGETEYDIYIDGRCSQHTTYDGDLDVIYTTRDGEQARQLSSKFEGMAVGSIMTTQVDRFCRLHPGAVDWTEYVAKVAKRAHGYLTKEDKRYLAADPWERELSDHFREHAKTVKDKTLRQHLNLDKSEHLSLLLSISSAFGVGRVTDVFTDEDLRINFEDLTRGRWNYERRRPNNYINVNYPMLTEMFRRFSSTDAEEWILYLNARYTQVVKPAIKAAADDQSDTDSNTDNPDQAAA